MKRVFYIVLLLMISINAYSRNIHFIFKMRPYIYDDVSVSNKTDEDVEFSIFVSQGLYSNYEIATMSVPNKSKIKNKIHFDNIPIIRGNVSDLGISTKNDNVSFEIVLSKTLNIIITKKPSFSQIQKYPRLLGCETKRIIINTNDNNTYSIKGNFYLCSKGYGTEIFERYVVFNDYFLKDAQPGSREYIMYDTYARCMPCYTEEDKKAIDNIVLNIYKKDNAYKKRIEENQEIHKDSLTYHIQEYVKLQNFSIHDKIGTQFVLQYDSNYFQLKSNLGEGNYELSTPFSRFIIKTDIPDFVTTHTTLYNRPSWVKYLGTIETIQNDGTHLILPYFECIPDTEDFDSYINSLVKRNGFIDQEIIYTDEIRAILDR